MNAHKTPRTNKKRKELSDDEIYTGWTAFSCMANFAAGLEKELNATKMELNKANEKANRLMLRTSFYTEPSQLNPWPRRSS